LSPTIAAAAATTPPSSGRPEPVDWKPQDKCYFCVDGKLLKVNEIGELVVEAGPVQPEAELNKHVSGLSTLALAELCFIGFHLVVTDYRIRRFKFEFRRHSATTAAAA